MFGQILMFIITALLRNAIEHPEDFFKLAVKVNEEMIEILPHVRKFIDKNNEFLGSTSKKYEKSVEVLSKRYVKFLKKQIDELRGKQRIVEERVTLTIEKFFDGSKQESFNYGISVVGGEFVATNVAAGAHATAETNNNLQQ
ncbi:MAG: hypothetical protein HC789_11625 [Microcoleus sp. CSU_2_2]|nr:hypothetical protein [Microcoleus sp. SU_5_3]NJS10964.1 hypothetical protein [Microcoleus sp. CSU_2_2]